MCFSAPASFVAGSVLLATGGVAVRSVWRGSRSALPLALTPFLFGVQQLAEGFVWLGLERHNPELTRNAALVFLFFALSFWPAWLPLCAACLDERPWARRLFGAVALVGTGWFALLFWPLLLHPDQYLQIELAHHSIAYNYPAVPLMQLGPRELFRALYMVMGGAPLIACTDRRARNFGLMLGGAALVTRLAYAHAFPSVWCFFAAVLAVYLSLALRQSPAKTK